MANTPETAKRRRLLNNEDNETGVETYGHCDPTFANSPSLTWRRGETAEEDQYRMGETAEEGEEGEEEVEEP